MYRVAVQLVSKVGWLYWYFIKKIASIQHLYGILQYHTIKSVRNKGHPMFKLAIYITFFFQPQWTVNQTQARWLEDALFTKK